MFDNSTNHFKDDIDQFLTAMKAKKYSIATVSSRRNALKRFTVFLTERDIHRFQDVTGDLISHYRSRLIDDNLKIHSVENYLEAVRRFYDYLESQSRIFENPMRDMIIRKSPPSLPAVLSVEHVKQLLSLPDLTRPLGIRNRAILETLYSTAVRRAELVAITLFDIDFTGKTLRVIGKGKKQRLVPLGEKAPPYIKEYLNQVRPHLQAKTNNPQHDALWLTQSGTPITNRTVNEIFRKYRDQVNGLGNFGPHTLRRSCATHMLANGAHPLLVAQLLGHHDLQTLSHYLKITITDLKLMHQKSKPGR